MLKWPKIASSTNKEFNLIDVLNVRRLSDVPVHMSTVSSDTNRVLQFLHQCDDICINIHNIWEKAF